MGLCTATRSYACGCARLHFAVHTDSTHECICAHICAPFLLHKPWESWGAVQELHCSLPLLGALGWGDSAIYEGLRAEPPRQAEMGGICVSLWELTYRGRAGAMSQLVKCGEQVLTEEED